MDETRREEKQSKYARLLWKTRKIQDEEAGKAKQAKEDAKKSAYDRSYYREKGSTGSKEQPLFNEEDIVFQEDNLDSGYSCDSNPPEKNHQAPRKVKRQTPKKIEPKKEKKSGFFGFFKRKKTVKKQCPVGCECLCHTEKTITSVAVDMALLTANANQLRILMVMYDLCGKIDWEQTRTLENGVSVPTGCEVRPFTWKCLLFLVLISISGQILIGVVNTCIFSFIQHPNKNFLARTVQSFSLMLVFFITCVNIVMTGIFAG
ncbi:Oidioi.mRNA.OKI2018_I69.chr2.g5974.t1.cds [Oikopleura dioica]|uniref:Oidioi.mRNA.OKI2018_I69.chr2.g5974.t1.cds n=1 Tax=Oikopleura dioica TaxID=34765 RepID=A0ABN7T2I6_OIKDI|nr:Oidioi.mRNA.OKI2018_I69.chr2.g5974.t1.cds [Oikopleura dioica]